MCVLISTYQTAAKSSCVYGQPAKPKHYFQGFRRSYCDVHKNTYGQLEILTKTWKLYEQMMMIMSNVKNLHSAWSVA